MQSNEGERSICRSIPIWGQLSVMYSGNLKRGVLHSDWDEGWVKGILVIIRGDWGCPREWCAAGLLLSFSVGTEDNGEIEREPQFYRQKIAHGIASWRCHLCPIICPDPPKFHPTPRILRASSLQLHPVSFLLSLFLTLFSGCKLCLEQKRTNIQGWWILGAQSGLGFEKDSPLGSSNKLLVPQNNPLAHLSGAPTYKVAVTESSTLFCPPPSHLSSPHLLMLPAGFTIMDVFIHVQLSEKELWIPARIWGWRHA